MSDEEHRGYVCAVSELLNNATAQELFDISERDPNQTDFDKGWRRACLEYGAKIDGP